MTEFGLLVLYVGAGVATGLFGMVLLRNQVALLAEGGSGLRAALLVLLRFGVAGLVFFVLARRGLVPALCGLAAYSVTVFAATTIARLRDARRFTA